MKSPESRSDGEKESSRIAGLENLEAGKLVHFLGQDDDGGTSLSLDTDFTLPDSLSDSPLTHIHDVVNLLLGLGPTLLDPAPRDRFRWNAHEDAAHYDIDHVQARFPHAEKSLIERLGRANWERRQYLIEKRFQIEEGSRESPKLDAIRPVDYSLENLNLESFPYGSGADSSDYNASEEAFGDGLDKNLSARRPFTLTTSIAPSDFQFSADDVQSTALTEPSKFISRVDGDQIELMSVRYAVPPPPHPNKQSGGEEFLCPFCAHRASNIKSHADWK
jgi:hypothetical protein